MKSDVTYDLLIIGGGISASVFASKYMKNNVTKKIGLIEIGRGLGGRSSTRISKKYKGWKLNHGSPNFNISNSKNNLLLKRYIDELLENKYIKIDESEIFFLNEDSNSEIKKLSEFSCGVNYLSLDSMGELSKKIIESNNLKEKIDYFFETSIVDMKFNNKEWLLTSNNGDKFKSKYLICSTNLLLHKRSLQILNVNQIPLRKAIPINNDKKIDLLLNCLEEQTFIPRLTFLIYTNENYSYKDYYSKKQRYFYLKNNLEKKYRFERIIFQLQDNNKLGIVIHSKNAELINSYMRAKDKEVFKKKIIINFNKLFEENSVVHKLTFDEKISIMKWRASQPSGLAVPLSLQFSKKYRIGFCGDWFEGDGFGRIEGSILSALILEKKIKDLIK
ncbi:MAG: NAD(P)-binding protein [Prochlorococcus marinus CUG1431]|uniref:NAD(P)-binding protein n=1 Tax=Prochlorococcus marinus CUG1433 TaxID=2774506 RepID=A0A9D9BTF4_PROMR|nr:NAD(P)-binding protein [Prochlorococcus marinus CUG1433]MBO6981021.1 NAD(P)-binding protein [Prochlorococcus marinus CUG1431]